VSRLEPIQPGVKEQAAVGKDGDLEPLHLSFKSEDVYYPLRFSSRQGVFDVNLTVLTREKLDYRKSAANLNKIGWSARDLKKNVVVSRDDFPKGLLVEDPLIGGEAPTLLIQGRRVGPGA
jgi:hypothetical protein